MVPPVIFFIRFIVPSRCLKVKFQATVVTWKQQWSTLLQFYQGCTLGIWRLLLVDAHQNDGDFFQGISYDIIPKLAGHCRLVRFVIHYPSFSIHDYHHYPSLSIMLVMIYDDFPWLVIVFCIPAQLPKYQPLSTIDNKSALEKTKTPKKKP